MMRLVAVVVLLLVGADLGRPWPDQAPPLREGSFELVQPELFAAAGGQPNAWADVDNDGDLDLFVAFRDAPNMLFRNDGGRFTSVGKELGLDDPRRTVGAVWFDFDGDGDLDLFTANQNGDANGLWRNDGSKFVDVARELG